MNHTHSHDHSHHNHSHAPQSFNLAFAIAITLNLAFTALEVIYGIRANSVGLLGDAAHNFGDSFGLLLAWGANWLLTKPASLRYSYGYRRMSILAAIINALILTASSALIAFESISKLLYGTQVNELVIILVAFIGIFINGSTAFLFLKGSHEDLNLKGAFLHLIYDALLSAGVVVAGIVIYYTGYMWVDPLAGLLIVAIILWGTWGLLRDSVNLILDAVPRHINQQEVSEYLQTLPNVVAIHDLHIWGLSTREVALSAHLVIPQDHVAHFDYKTINEVLKDSFKIHHATIQVEIENSNFICLRSEQC